MDLAGLRPWLLITHVLSLLAFVLVHGASASVAFKLRSEREGARIRALLELSNAYLNWAYAALGLLLLSGIGLAFIGGWWTNGQLWLWVSIGILVAILAGMYAVASPYFETLRHAVGLRTYQDVRAGLDPPPPVPESELVELLVSGRPALTAVIGLGGIAAVTWLMVLKPF